MTDRFTIRPATEADMPRLVEIGNAQSYEPTTLEETLRTERNRRPEDPLLRLVATSPDGYVTGFGTAWSGFGNKPGEFSIKVRVDEPYRGRGTGRTLYAQLEEWVLTQGARSIKSGVNEVHPDALAWAERRGYLQEHHIFKSKLSLPDWDPAPFAYAVDRARSQGVRFTDLGAEQTGEESLRRFYDFIGPIVDDMPGASGRVRPPYERWRSNLDKDPHWDPRSVILAVDGDRWAAFAAINRLPGGALYNGFTGVDREYRGRGLALAIKVIALNYARSLGAPYVTTSNHSVNQPMLAVNRRLGYVPSPGSFTLCKELAR